MNQYVTAGVLAVRWLGLLWISAGAWMLAANFIESAAEFNPSFPGYYFQSQAVRPLLAVAVGVILWVVARPLGKRIARGLGDN